MLVAADSPMANLLRTVNQHEDWFAQGVFQLVFSRFSTRTPCANMVIYAEVLNI